MFVDQAAHCDEGRIAAVDGGSDAPAKFVQSREEFGQADEIEFETDELKPSIILAAHDFGGTQIQAGLPAFIGVFALRSNPANSLHWLKQGRRLVNEDVQPLGTPGAIRPIAPVLFELLQEVLNQQMRMGQDGGLRKLSLISSSGEAARSVPPWGSVPFSISESETQATSSAVMFDRGQASLALCLS